MWKVILILTFILRCISILFIATAVVIRIVFIITTAVVFVRVAYVSVFVRSAKLNTRNREPDEA